MSTPSAVLGAAGREETGARSRQRGERNFWGGLALAMAAAAFVGFAPSYYLKAHFAQGPVLTPLLHLHGAAMSGWIALLIIQTSLIRTHHLAWHRRLGIAGVIYATLLMILGGVTAIVRAKQGLLGPGDPGPLVFLAIPLMTLIVFPVLMGAAVYYRRRPDYHKRLVMIGTTEFITAAVGRFPVIGSLGPLAFFPVTDLFLLAIAIRDWKTLGRLHPATRWGGLLLIVSQPLRLVISGTPAWLAFAKWVTSG